MKQFIFLLSLGSSFFANADIKEVKIAMGTNKPPYIFTATAGGLECEILRESFKAVNIKFVPSFLPPNRGEVLFKAKKVDGVINKLENSFEGFPSNTYIDYYNVAVSLRSKKLSIVNVADLSKYSVAGWQTAKKHLGPEFAAMAEKNTEYTEIAEQLIQVKQLLKKRVDVIVGDILIIKYYQRKLKEEDNLQDEISIHDLFKTTNYVIMFQSKELRDQFNLGLAIIRKNKAYSKILDKYASYQAKK